MFLDRFFKKKFLDTFVPEHVQLNLDVRINNIKKKFCEVSMKEQKVLKNKK